MQSITDINNGNIKYITSVINSISNNKQDIVSIDINQNEMGGKHNDVSNLLFKINNEIKN